MNPSSKPAIDSVVRNVCPLCPEQDAVLVSARDGRIVSIDGDGEHPFTGGHICVKGRNANDVLDHPNRVTHPLMKHRNQWLPVSWDTALEAIADRIHDVRESYGPLAFTASDASLGNVKGLAPGLFIRSLGSPNLLSNLDLCAGPGIASDLITVGDQVTTYFSVTDFRNSRCIFIAGSNIAASLPRQWRDTKLALADGAKLIVADPRRTELAELADIWLQVRPGSDGALAMGMLNVIINEGLYDEQFVAEWCIGFEQLVHRVQAYSPEKVAGITWIPVEDIEQTARLYAQTSPACVRANLGVTQRNNSFPASRAFTALAAITGNIDVPGGHLLARMPEGLRACQDIAKGFPLPESVTVQQIGVEQLPLWAGPDSAVIADGYASIPMVLRAIITSEPYPVKAWFISGPNVVLTYPDTKRVVEALRSLELLVVCTDMMSPTAELADFVLPRAHPFETDRITGSGDGQWIMAAERVVEPRGESWDDIKIFHELTGVLKRKGYLDRSFIPWKDMHEFNDYRLEDMGITFEDLKQHGVMSVPVAYRKYQDAGFRTPSGKVELYSSLLQKHGYDPLPSYQESPTSEISNPQLASKHPLLLITSRKKHQFLSRSPVCAWMRALDPYPELEIHPDTAQDRQIADGELLWIETPKGKCRHKARVTDRIHPKVVNGCFGWWFPEQSAPEHGCLEANVNALLAYEPPHDPIAGINSVQGVLCEVYRAEE
jgi:thiosulfate reductase/polysulfide reductase chain A